MNNYNILDVNGYMFEVKSFCEDYLSIECVPCTDRDLDYIKRYVDSMTHKAKNILFNKSDKTYPNEFDNTELYHNGFAFIKTIGLLDFKHKLYGLWPTYISDDGIIEFTFDHLQKDEFCPRDCTYLSLTEKRQRELKNLTGMDSHHFCKKYGDRLYHLEAHPDLHKCEMCLKEPNKAPKYIILSRGSPFGDGDTVQGYMTSKDFAITLCDDYNNECKLKGLNEDCYYFIEATPDSSLYDINLCLDHFITLYRKVD